MPASDEVEARVCELHGAGRFADAMTVALGSYGPEIVGFLVSLVATRDEAFDVFGQACLGMWSTFPSFAWRSSFRTWAYVIARRAYLRHVDSAYERRHVDLSQVPSLSALEARIRTQTAPYFRTDVKSRAARLRDRLTPEERMLLTLRVDREMTWEQIAEVMDDGAIVDPQTLQRACAAWRKRFERTKVRLRAFAKSEGLLGEGA